MKIVIIFTMMLTLLQLGCTSTPDAKNIPRETARAAVIMLAKTTVVADESCASLARSKQDATLAKKCADAYDVIRPLLTSAESGVDAWESGSRNQIACAIAKSASALLDIVEAVKAIGSTLPPSVDDSLKFVASIVGECHGT